MVTSTFKSTTRRSSLAPSDAGSSTRSCRSRSLSRYFGRFPPPPLESDDFTTPRGKFVNKMRGSGFGEITSLDDLADEFFGVKGLGVEEYDGLVRSGSDRIGSNRTGRPTERFRMETEASSRRGRSVSKKGCNGDGSRGLRRSASVVRGRSGDLEDEKKLLNGELSCRDWIVRERNDLYGKDRNSRQRRSTSVARYWYSDLEDEKILYSGESSHHDRVARERKGNYRSSKQRRSASVAWYRYSDLESDTNKSYDSSKIRSSDNGNFQQSASKKYTNASYALRRSMGQKDLLQSVDNYSGHSSSFTDDEVWDVCSLKSGGEKRIQAVDTQEKAEDPTGDGDESGQYEAMRNEVRHAVREIRTELEKVMVKTKPATLTNCDVNQAKVSNINVIAEIRRNYTNKLEQSEKRKQDLLAELAAEEQHGQELTNVVRELLPASKQAASIATPRSRRKSNDRTRMSKRLTEEAERYFEDFLSNVEDTDLSSFDGERSDTSSILGGRSKLREPVAVHNAISEVHAILEKASLPAETDGVLLPWLEWETSNDVTPSPCKSKAGMPWTAAQEANAACDSNTHLSSLGSWSPEDNENYPEVSSDAIQNTFKVGSYMMQSSCFLSVRGAVSSFDMEEYLVLRRHEDLLFEISKHRQRIESGSLIMCARTTLI